MSTLDGKPDTFIGSVIIALVLEGVYAPNHVEKDFFVLHHLI